MTHVKKITYFALAFLYHVEKVVFFLLQDFLNPTTTSSLFRKNMKWPSEIKIMLFCFFSLLALFIPQNECPKLCWNFIMKNLPGHFIEHKTCTFEGWHMMITHQRKAPFQKDSQIFCARELYYILKLIYP